MKRKNIKSPKNKRMAVEERRAQLIQLGLHLFGEYAYDEISTDEIVEKAGISKGLLYHYFPTKRDFYVETVREVAKKIKAATRPDPQAPFQQALAISLDNFLSFIEENSSLYKMLLQGGIGKDPEVQKIIENVRQTSVRRIIKQRGLSPANSPIKLIIYGWIGLLEYSSLYWLDHLPDYNRRDFIEILLHSLDKVLSFKKGVFS